MMNLVNNILRTPGTLEHMNCISGIIHILHCGVITMLNETVTPQLLQEIFIAASVT